ncbi:YceI family protein [Maribacter sp. 2-571]|uniref:YceI family protein n=1 Tax=Maribacter sp. 2-571 TaxID=3417569 RepID=UPI003D32F35C
MKTKYIIEKVHSTLAFRARLLGISGIGGTFNEFSGSFIRNNEDWSATEVRVEIDVASIDTGVEQRDEHLQAEYWFHTEAHPKIVFTSTSFKARKKNQFVLQGELHLKGNKWDVTFILNKGGNAKDKDGVEKIGFTAKTKIDREAFGIAKGAELPNGAVFLGKKVSVRFDLQLAEAK